MSTFLKVVTIWIMGISITQAQLLDETAELSFVEKLFSTREKPIFESLLKEAKSKKIPEQTIFEAEFLFAIDTESDQNLIRLIERANALVKNFSLKNSEIFSERDDFLATVEFLHAIEAFQKGDEKKFKQHAQQAFWLSPNQAPLIGSYIRKFKIQSLKKNYQLPQDLKLTSIEGTEITIESLLKKHSTIAIYFYNPWSRQAMLEVDNVAKFHKLCETKKIYHIHHNTESSPSVEQDLTDYLNVIGKTNAHLLTQSAKGDNLLDDLRIKSTPTVILFNQHGKIIKYGDPQNILD